MVGFGKKKDYRAYTDEETKYEPASKSNRLVRLVGWFSQLCLSVAM